MHCSNIRLSRLRSEKVFSCRFAWKLSEDMLYLLKLFACEYTSQPVKQMAAHFRLPFLLARVVMKT